MGRRGVRPPPYSSDAQRTPDRFGPSTLLFSLFLVPKRGLPRKTFRCCSISSRLCWMGPAGLLASVSRRQNTLCSTCCLRLSSTSAFSKIKKNIYSGPSAGSDANLQSSVAPSAIMSAYECSLSENDNTAADGIYIRV